MVKDDGVEGFLDWERYLRDEKERGNDPLRFLFEEARKYDAPDEFESDDEIDADTNVFLAVELEEFI